jgi:hypothetical protein
MSDAPHNQRMPFQFGLRDAFWVILVRALVAGWIVDSTRMQRATLQGLRSLAELDRCRLESLELREQVEQLRNQLNQCKRRQTK